MTLTEEVKERIIEILDSEEFMSNLYEGLTPKQRKELGMVYTPARVCIQMIEKFDCETLAGRTILDPACGSGNLLIACLIAGADSDKLFGNEYDLTAVDLCKRRLNRACKLLGKPYIKDWQIHQGDATQVRCLTNFSPTYRFKEYEQINLFSNFF
jgi:predicted RNA methylase